jgi:ArsR family transcriptional regulator
VVDEIDVLRALAHPVRWGILQRLAAEPGICACDFTEFFDVSQPTVSAHLKVLREAGLVTTQRKGTTICYTLVAGQLGALAGQLGAMAATAPATPAVPAVPATPAAQSVQGGTPAAASAEDPG